MNEPVNPSAFALEVDDETDSQMEKPKSESRAKTVHNDVDSVSAKAPSILPEKL